MSRSRTFKKKLGGREVEITLNFADLHPDLDIDAEARSIPQTLAHLAELTEATIVEFREEDAKYRRWRGQRTERELAENGKLPEWRIENVVNADSDFLRRKTRLAELEGELEFLRAYTEAVRTQAFMIKSRIDVLKVQ